MTPVHTTLPASENGSKLRLMVGAVIYVRVSTKEQTENLSLPTQLRACEEYCRREGYEVVERFKEEGESAKTTDRTELQNLLKYCRTHKGKVHFVIVYNLTRFAREKYDHFALRAFLKSLGISLRSATEPIDDTSTGKLMEGVLAAFAQFDNDVRAERTRAGMRTALEQGRWTFIPPVGYLNAPKWTGKSLMPDPDRGALVTRAFEEFATGRFTKEELDKFDVEGILAFAERVLPRASDLWVQASLNQKQRLQQLFFPDGIAFDGKRFVRTAVTTHAFNYLTCADDAENQVASPTATVAFPLTGSVLRPAA